MAKQIGLTILVLAIALVYYSYEIVINAQEYSPIVETKYGKVRGNVGTSRDGRRFYQYRGIPYAKPPVGELRYEPPQPPENWVQVKDTIAYGNVCAQADILVGIIIGHEDCLCINVFTPKLKSAGSKTLPVLVWIHGGGHISWTANMFGPEYFMDHDVVLVSMNFRLGTLGFLNTGDGVARGNMGLKDQSLALRWVHDNIAAFNGDPNRVTLFGESAGAACVHFHTLSPMSKGFFNKAILQSGSATGLWNIKENPKMQAQRYAKKLGCPTASGKKMVQCLKKQPLNSLLHANSEVFAALKDGAALFGPTIEVVNDKDTFITEYPAKIVKSGGALKIPMMVGHMSDEALFFTPRIRLNGSILDEFNQDFRRNFGRFTYFQDNYGTEEIMQQVKEFYFGPNAKDKKLSTKDLDSVDKLVGDFMFVICTQATIETQSQFSPVYAYFYSYKGEYSFTNLLYAMKRRFFGSGFLEIVWHTATSILERRIFGSNNLPVEGAAHADELRLLFRMGAYDEARPGDKDYKFSKELVKLWVDFATDEKSMEIQGHHWLPWNESKKYLHLDNKVSFTDTPFKDRMDFWKKLKYFV